MGYIYKIIDTTTHEYDIGKRCNTDPKTDNYWGSGYNRVCRSAKKHKGANGRYRKDILVNGISCKIELGLFEKEIIGNLFETDSLCLNQVAGGMGGGAKGNTNGRGNKGKKMPPRTAEQNAAKSVAMMGNTNAKGNKGNKHPPRTAEQKAAHSARMKEYYRLRKLREANACTTS